MLIDFKTNSFELVPYLISAGIIDLFIHLAKYFKYFYALK